MKKKATEIKIPTPELVDIELLKIDKNNVKMHTNEQLHDIGVLMEWIGFTDPIIADSNFDVYAGKGSVLEAVEKGMKKVPVIFMPKNWSEKKKQAFMLMDNKVNESRWQADQFKLIFDSLGPDSFKMFEMKFDNMFEKSPNLTEEEWQGMPEFKQDSVKCYQMIIVRFDSKKDVDKFAKLVKQNINPTTKSIYFPEQKRQKMDTEWVNET